MQSAAVGISAIAQLAQQNGGDVAAAGAGIVMLLLTCMFVVIGILLTVFWIWMLIDCARRDFEGSEKVVWILVIVLLGALGAAIYYFVGRKKGRLPGSA
jgi:hypothetical protein